MAEIRDLATRAATSGRGLLAFVPPGLEPLVSAVNGKGHLTAEGIDALEALVAHVNGRVGGAPFARLHLAMAPAVEISRRLMAAPRSEHLRQPLAQAAAGAFMVAARIAFEAHDDDTSLRLYQEAVRAAVDAPAWQRTAMNTSRPWSSSTRVVMSQPPELSPTQYGLGRTGRPRRASLRCLSRAKRLIFGAVGAHVRRMWE
ncbi:hypothetical protein [Spongiactinospora gelatinilytica]|uniref:hypothetical protein n=1 Tax=Spongiactinospora gelatinilytica TaxID=2666298 RepID=UPI0011B9457C|nr:hypothetical protein [Spongiactinospora gelatinilytica]